MNWKIPVYVYSTVNIKRFNRFGHPSKRRQDYATHSYHALAISSIIGHQYNLDNQENPISIERVYGKIIFGSLHPAFFGDAPKSIQEQYPDLYNAFRVAKKTNGEMLVQQFSEPYQEIFRDYLVNTKDESIEGEITRQAENFSVLMKCEEELKAVSNRYFKKMKSVIKKHIQTGAPLTISQTTIDELKDEEYEGFEQKSFYDVYLDTVEAIKNSPLPEVQWYFKEVYFSPISLIIQNMDEVYRWQTPDCKDDTDSHHSFFVAMWTFVLGLVSRIVYEKEIDIASAVSKAIFHDIHESLTSDILSYVKRINEEVKSLVDKMEDDKNGLIHYLLPLSLREVFYSYICDPKSDNAEGELVHISDKVDTIIKALKEIKRGNTVPFTEKYDSSMRMVMEYAKEHNEVRDFLAFALHEFNMTH